MFKNRLFNRNKQSDSALNQEMRDWTLTDLQAYIRGQNPVHTLDEKGLVEVIRKVTSKEKPTKAYPEGKRFVEAGDNDIRIKKLFDLMLSICTSPKLSVEALEQIETFHSLYWDIIEAYDKRHKQIYGDRLKDHTLKAVATVETKTHLQNKMDLIHQ
jgi:hypothetical protein